MVMNKFKQINNNIRLLLFNYGKNQFNTNYVINQPCNGGIRISPSHCKRKSNVKTKMY